MRTSMLMLLFGGKFIGLALSGENECSLMNRVEEGAGESEIFGMVFSGDDRGFAGGTGYEVKVREVEIGDRFGG